MTAVWDKIEQLAKHFESKFNATGETIEGTLDKEYDWHNQLWSSNRYRRAHVEVVDKRDSHGIYILHTTIFPHFNDPSPIFGFDAVCGKNKITGAFHDFSHAGDPNSFMYLWFKAQVHDLEWNKPRELPEWARMIFSPAMVAAGNLQDQAEVDQLCDTAKTTLDFYLNNVGLDQQSGADYHMAQNRYCHWQKQNPHVIRSMVSMGVPEPVMKRFVDTVLFPEVA
jgi:hypothetical protein